MVRSHRWPVSRADQVRAYLSARNAKCPKCRYDLRGLRDPRCPECGLELDVAALHGGRTWVIPAALARGMSVVVVVNVVLALAVMASAVLHHGNLPKLAWLTPAVLGAFACAIAYWPVFLKLNTTHIETPPPAVGAAWLAAAMQGAGLVLLWV